jgi:hypothetical protein
MAGRVMHRRCKTPDIKLIDSGTENGSPSRLEKNVASQPFAACSTALRFALAAREDDQSARKV